MTSLLWIGFFLFLLLGVSRLMGERKGNITFDNYYLHLKDQVRVITEELHAQGREVECIYYRTFLVDGEDYLLREAHVRGDQRLFLKKIDRRKNH
ncbi:hypothetical protein SAMN05421743_103235 [Thalassobacillus cyri]|uniref:Uncharacterized protein n=1 Tax=Thalassobacillus cyri TaxID=571932 RepID=A0A1H3ZG74_9BACI|nr:hypothetical protein [Thalassobacillus cyri]SEA22710.1 hypothetical protein SAMN05421743_103235 [Thalassobacillus cyri]